MTSPRNLPAPRADIPTRRTRRSRAQREDQLRSVIGTAAAAILTFDTEGAVHSFNLAAERMFGYPLAEVIERPVDRLLRLKGNGTLVPELLVRCEQIGGRLTREALALRKDGSTLRVELALSKVIGFELFTAVVRDIAHRSRLEALLGEVAIAEQERIGRDLHDTVGQTLAALALSADRASRELQCQDGIDVLTELAAGIRGALSGVRAAARGLTRVANDARSLVAAIEALAIAVEKHHRIECALHVETPAFLPEPVAEHLYRITSEAVANAVHHARPTQVTIRLLPDRDRWTLEVRDDGVGLPEQPPKGGIGTWIMRSRASAIEADLNIDNLSSGGTIVTCRFPVPRHATE